MTKTWAGNPGIVRPAWLIVVFALVCALPGPVARAAPGDIRITLMSAKFDWSTTEFSGYSFMCFGVDTAGGTNDDCYGFYRTAAGKSFVGGSGVVRSDLRKIPTRFPSPTVTVSRKITSAQRQAALKVIDVWNEREYEPSPLNAMELVRELSQASGFVVPPRKNEPAEGLLKRLQAFNP